MKRLLLVATGLLVASVASARSLAKVYGVLNNDASFAAFLPQFEAGTSGFMNGDAALWKQHVSRHDPVTLFGGWGAYERGWAEVSPRYDWAAARFRPSGAAVEVEYLAIESSGDLAYTVAIERSQALIVGQEQPAPLALRVTHIYRKEGGAWRLVHRHADNIMGKTAPDSVIQKGAGGA